MYGRSAPAVTCNDGSPYVYFARNCTANWDRKPGDPDFCALTQRVFILVVASGGRDVLSPTLPAPLQGAFCYDAASCAARAANATSSSQLPLTAFPDGILSPFAEANPNLYKAAAAVLPYCSSDLWLGRAAGFQGADILAAVVNDLYAPPPPQLGNSTLLDANYVIIIGGAGVMVQLDDLAAVIRSRHAAHNASVTVVGYCDGCLLMEEASSSPGSPLCTTDSNCPAGVALPQALPMWNATLPPWCTDDNTTQCLLATGLFQHLKDAETPVFVAAQQYDAVQLSSAGCWPVNSSTACGAWAQNSYSPAVRELLASIGGEGSARKVFPFSAACSQPSYGATSTQYYHTLVRYQDVYNHTHNDSTSQAAFAFLEAVAPAGPGPSSYGVFGDTCTTFDCNESGCAA